MEIRKIENIMRLMSNYQIDELEISDNQQKILTVTRLFTSKKAMLSRLIRETVCTLKK